MRHLILTAAVIAASQFSFGQFRPANFTFGNNIVNGRQRVAPNVRPVDMHIVDKLDEIEYNTQETLRYQREEAEQRRQDRLFQQRANNPDMVFPIAFTRLVSVRGREIKLNNGDMFKVSLTAQSIVHVWNEDDVVDVYENTDKRGRVTNYTLVNVTRNSQTEADID